MRGEKGLLDRLQRNPKTHFDLILRVTGSAADAASGLTQRGIIVRRTLSLTNSLSISATGAQASQLAREPWAESLEEDKPVRALH